ncbi:MAG: 7TM diverse intracellular signaling domain-containing protein [Chitinophagaceae bacterium]
MKLAKLFLCLFLFCGKASAAADSIIFNPSAPPLPIRPYFGIIEDSAGVYTPESLLANQDLFTPIAGFKTSKHSSVFWLQCRIYSPATADAIVSFQHLTYADLYIMPDTPRADIIHHQAGAFRPANEISAGDSRFSFKLKLSAGISYKVLIRSRHSKQYQPIFDFELNDLYHFARTKQQRELIDYWFQGAGVLLFIYALITWVTTRYRPYLWLAVFITGLSLYNLALNRYLIDWFFPSDPIFGWRLTIHCLHLAIVGLYLLVLDFWKMKEKNTGLFRIGKLILYGIFFLSALSFFINYYAADFRAMSYVNSAFLIVQMFYLIRTLMLWKRFDKQERFLAYGIIIYMSVALFGALALFIIGESVFRMFTILSGSILVVISLLFLTGITGKLWQNEKDKTLYLSQLNQLQQRQNELLEESVKERTLELNHRNEHIELLMNELNHRVKNNLQLLYSLNSLQLTGSKEANANNILTDNVARIKAMMLINDRLNPGNNSDNKNISPLKFITDIAEHSKRMFAQSATIDIRLDIDEHLILNATSGLCLGLIVSELITNSCKHAFSTQPVPQISIQIVQAVDEWMMNYSDNGTGFNTSSVNNFGLMLIADLTRQLKGRYKLAQQGEGASYFFNFSNKV